ncbi:MAG TPA: 2-oxoacid:ferredoxin oxidoreductase subunit beta [Armatimonadota bacterium]|jgi:2-oxoglutarate ferredoxin oxidoreductase subunit beta
MSILKDYQSQATTWCPHCGNFNILQAMKTALIELGLEPWQVCLVSGIGQAAKLPHYLKCNYFNGLHGRALPAATGLKAARPDLPVIVTTGDGDCYGEGGNHFLHALRRNPDITVIVHDNQVYGLTKGQASPTSPRELVTRTQPHGPQSEPFAPLALAVLLHAPFVARGYAGDLPHLKDLIVQAVSHRGLALVDVLQPCVTFNHLNTYEWYAERVYPLEEGYDPTDRAAALERAQEWGERIPLGVLYREERSVFGDDLPAISRGPVTERPRTPQQVESLLAEFEFAAAHGVAPS